MSKFSQLLGGARLHGPLLLLLLGGCDNPPPAFRETLLPIGQADPYSSEDASAENSQGSTDLDPAQDDQTAADRGEDGPELPAVAVARWSFQASTLAAGSLALDVSGGEIQQRFKMDNNLLSSKLDFNQVNRPVVTEAFLQGTDQLSKTENFAQSASASGLLDVLVVVDNSGSMDVEQTNLSGKLLPLLTYVKDSDWKIGVVTTDPKDGCLRGLIRKGDQNPEQLFAKAVSAGIQGSGNERGILQAVNGLKGECNQSGSWLRSNSTVAVLIISDEDNCSSNGGDCGSDEWAKADYLVNYLKGIRQVGTNARTYGLIWHPSVAKSACNTALNRASVYAEAIQRTGGSYGSICDADYSNTLRAISLDLSVILKTQFALQYAPYARSLKVYVNNQLQSSGYKLSGNVLEFTQPPAAGAAIKVSYEFSNEPPKNEFFLANAADASALQVYLDGAATTSYTYDAGARSVRFNNAPMVYEIKAVYRKAGELKADFRIGTSAKPTSVRVSVDGTATTAFTYSTATGLVRMNQSPKDQAVVSISFDQQLEPKLRYPIYAAAEMRNQVRVYDAKTKRPIAVTVDGDEIVFPLQQFTALRDVLVVYPAMGSKSLLVDLGRSILEDSLKVKGLKSGVCDASLLTLNGSAVDMSRCSFSANEGVLISFTYAADHQNSFELGPLDLDLSQYRWQVAINGTESKDFSIDQGLLSFTTLPVNAKVEVSLFKITP